MPVNATHPEQTAGPRRYRLHVGQAARAPVACTVPLESAVAVAARPDGPERGPQQSLAQAAQADGHPVTVRAASPRRRAWAVHAEPIRAERLDLGVRHVRKVIAERERARDRAHPVHRDGRQPAEHILALLQLLPALKQALLAQELRAARRRIVTFWVHCPCTPRPCESLTSTQRG